MRQVAKDCAFLPLALAIAGSMPLVMDDPMSEDAWSGLHKNLEDKANMQQSAGAQQDSLGTVLAVSFKGLGKWQRTHFLQLAALAKNVLAPMEMLCHLWDEVCVGENV